MEWNRWKKSHALTFLRRLHHKSIVRSVLHNEGFTDGPALYRYVPLPSLSIMMCLLLWRSLEPLLTL